MKQRIISEIWIYPVKSLGGIRIHSSKVKLKGLEYDRRWMLIDETNQFMTQRVFPQMCFFKLSLATDKFIVQHSGQLLDIPFYSENETLQATVWNDIVGVQEVSRKHSEWFSEILKLKCRLVSFPEKNPRASDPHFSPDESQVSLADSFPLLIIGQSSLDDLNSRLIKPLPMNRFRPNVVFTGGAPYEEDEWHRLSAGGNRFAAVKPCSRCAVTTIDQETGEKGKEPLATLATYRNRDGKVYFGQNLIPIDYLVISQGDEILLEDKEVNGH